MKTILIGLLIVTQILANINLLAPEWLKNAYSDRNIQSSIACFGKVPYGHSLIGKLVMGSSSTGCKPLGSIRNELKNGDPVILVLKRGDCRFSDKAVNAQAIGASALIILDSTVNTIDDIIPISKDKEANLLSIPTLLAREKEFELMPGIKTWTNPSEDDEFPILSISFPIVKEY